MSNKKFRHKALKVIHETIKGMVKAGTVDQGVLDEFTTLMKEQKVEENEAGE